MRSHLVAFSIGVCLIVAAGPAPAEERGFRAGAAVVEVDPPKFPVIVNGGFLEARANAVRDHLHARALVLDDGATRLAIAVVDSCMMPRDLIDRAKALAVRRTGIPADRILVSATHTHTAPSLMGSLGTPPDPEYVAFLPDRIAEAIARASGNLEPAEVGWAVVDDSDHTHCRSWIRRPDRILTDPFGLATARANMHPGYESPDVIGPAGPVDPGLSVLAARSTGGRPIALLANYSMHYFGTEPVSADYYGRFCTAVARSVGGDEAGRPPFVAMMSQGTSGDQHWMDYARPKSDITIDRYSEAVAGKAAEAYRAIAFRDRAPLAMAESHLTLRRRVPDEGRLAWARKVAAAMGDRLPKTLPEVYAQEALILHAEPERELTLQAVRVGDLGIAAIPDEVYALTGLKLKARSPLVPTFTMALANGSEGYIPPPEQHVLGGYTTWPARTAGLEVRAEPKIVEAVLGLLEKVAGRPRRTPATPNGPYAEAVLASKPLAYWRLGEMEGPDAADATGHGHRARIEDGIALYLEGPPSAAFSGEGTTNRAIHCAGGRLAADLPGVGAASSVELWFWNGLPNAARAVTGTLASRGPEGDRLGIGGVGAASGRLVLGPGDGGLSGTTEIAPRTWHHVVLVRDGEDASVYLDGTLEVSGRLPRLAGDRFVFGGGDDGTSGLEGKLDEVAVYDRALPAAEVAAHHRSSVPAAAARP